MREDLKVRAREIEVGEKTEAGLKNIIDSLESLIDEMGEHLRKVRESYASISEEKGGEKK